MVPICLLIPKFTYHLCLPEIPLQSINISFGLNISTHCEVFPYINDNDLIPKNFVLISFP